MNEVTIYVPSSSANVGLGFDTWSLGLTSPYMMVTFEKKVGRGISVDVNSPIKLPVGREFGYGAKMALQSFLEGYHISGGANLVFKDYGYPMGGLGRSGAESVGTILGAAIAYGIPLTRDDVVMLSAKGEPGEHKDNVSGSTNGEFNIISKSPQNGRYIIQSYNSPRNLGVAIGLSSHQKTSGTEGMRQVLREPVTTDDFITQIGLVSQSTAALLNGNTDLFLELITGDKYHEPRRADAGGYGNFNAAELSELKRNLFKEFHVALNVSGAGPTMSFLYNKDRYPVGLVSDVSSRIIKWFEKRGIVMKIDSTEINTSGGAYGYAQRNYGYKSL